MKRKDWIEGRQYDPATVPKKYWEEITPEDPRYMEVLKQIAEGEVKVVESGKVVGEGWSVSWEDAQEPIEKTPKLKPKS
jgi:hypothetical protein